jgi:hypothetical protein
MRVKKINVYKFNELSDTAKEKARDWWRTSSADDNYWAENVKEDARQCFALIGIEIEKIYWSGFSSQGDGAQFVGSWRASDVKPGQLKDHAPKDEWLHRIAETFEEIAVQCPKASFYVKSSGHYSHEYCTEFEVELGVDEEGGARHIIRGRKFITEDQVIEAARECMRWIYRQLEKEYEWQNADEQVDETILENEYDFTEEGKRSVTL